MPTLKNGSSCILLIGDAQEVQAGETVEVPEELKELVVTVKQEKKMSLLPKSTAAL